MLVLNNFIGACSKLPMLKKNLWIIIGPRGIGAKARLLVGLCLTEAKVANDLFWEFDWSNHIVKVSTRAKKPRKWINIQDQQFIRANENIKNHCFWAEDVEGQYTNVYRPDTMTVLTFCLGKQIELTKGLKIKWKRNQHVPTMQSNRFWPRSVTTFSICIL